MLIRRPGRPKVVYAGLACPPVVRDRMTDFSCHQGRFHVASGRWCFRFWDAEGRAARVS